MPDKTEILKTAASQLRELSVKTDEFEKTAEHNKLAEHVLKKMIDKNMLTSPSEVLAKLAELRQSSDEDLKVTEKAIEIDGKNESLSKLGSLSDHPTADGLDPLTALLLEDL